jgi:chorismate mutase / prephenate dehydratase
MRIAYFGQEGSFAHETALKAFPKAQGYLPGTDAHGVLRLLYKGLANCGVLPVENSANGIITESVDALLSQEFIRSKHRIREQITLPVHLEVLSKGSLGSIRTLYSHPAPFSYLDRWLRKKFPHIKRVATTSTSEGAARAATDPGSAAIANQAAAKIYGLKILKVKLPLEPNQTRFYAISSKPLSTKSPQCTAICFGLPNRPGSLVEILSVFAKNKINLTRITSRPLVKRKKGFRPGEYVFWVDFEGHPSIPHVRIALKEASQITAFLDVVGAYSNRQLR